jgi:hypothetical protein
MIRPASKAFGLSRDQNARAATTTTSILPFTLKSVPMGSQEISNDGALFRHPVTAV